MIGATLTAIVAAVAVLGGAPGRGGDPGPVEPDPHHPWITIYTVAPGPAVGLCDRFIAWNGGEAGCSYEYADDLSADVPAAAREMAETGKGLVWVWDNPPTGGPCTSWESSNPIRTGMSCWAWTFEANQ